MTQYRRTTYRGASIAALVFLLALPASAWASGPLTSANPYFRPNAPRLVVGTDFSAGGVPAGFTLLTTHTFPYNYNGTTNDGFLGSVVSSVYQETATGNLAFSYVFNNLNVPGGPGTEISSATIGDVNNPWDGFTISGAGSDGSGSSHGIGSPSDPNSNWSNGDPYSIALNTDDQGLKINFNLAVFSIGTQLVSALPLGSGAITPTSDMSSLIWLTTDAKNYQTTDIGLSDTARVGTSEAFAPAPGPLNPVPEPSTFALAAIAGIGGIWLRRRKK